MGTSNWQNIPFIIDLIRRINPQSILDIGVGFGRWGFLAREFLEIWNYGNYYNNWIIKLDGVEIFSEYIKPYHKEFYNQIFIQDAFSFINNLQHKYNLIFCGDIIEHIEKNSALQLIDNALSKTDFLIINVPLGNNWKQNAINNNPYEEHLSVWYKSDFKKYKYSIKKKFRDYIYRPYLSICITHNTENLKKIKSPFPDKILNLKLLLKNKFLLYKLINKNK